LRHPENLTPAGEIALHKLLNINRNLQIAYLLKDQFRLVWSTRGRDGLGDTCDNGSGGWRSPASRRSSASPRASSAAFLSRGKPDPRRTCRAAGMPPLLGAPAAAILSKEADFSKSEEVMRRSIIGAAQSGSGPRSSRIPGRLPAHSIMQTLRTASQSKGSPDRPCRGEGVARTSAWPRGPHGPTL